MNISGPLEVSQPHVAAPDTSNFTDHQSVSSPTPTSPSFPEASTSEAVCASPQDQREDALSTKADSVQSSKTKKRFPELDIRGAMADLDIRKGGKRSGIEDFYIQLDEPHRMFWCPGDVVKGTYYFCPYFRCHSDFFQVKCT